MGTFGKYDFWRFYKKWYWIFSLKLQDISAPPLPQICPCSIECKAYFVLIEYLFIVSAYLRLRSGRVAGTPACLAFLSGCTCRIRGRLYTISPCRELRLLNRIYTAELLYLLCSPPAGLLQTHPWELIYLKGERVWWIIKSNAEGRTQYVMLGTDLNYSTEDKS